MKAFFTYLSIILLVCMVKYSVQAQIPQSIPYQAVARTTSGTLLASQNIALRFRIHNLFANGPVMYSELFTTTTTNLGLFNVNIGQGTVESGSFSSINWSFGSKYLQVEMDTAAGNNYVDMGTQQLLSVPYSLYSGGSSSSWNLNLNGGTNPSSNAIGTSDNQPLIFKTNNTENMRIGATGNVGIGTPTPGEKLEVNGKLKFTADGSTISKAPRAIHAGPVTTGCPMTLAAGAALISQSFTLTSAATVYIIANMNSTYAGRRDMNLLVDGSAKTRTIVYTPTLEWSDGTLHWSGILSAGSHTITVTGSVANTYGCGPDWGGMDILIYEQ